MTGPNQRERILPRLIEDEMKESFIDYSMSVIVSRALPDVRDGLKPVHRRILYAMNELGLTPGRPYKKSATVVGDVLGKYHPHGDSAVYDALVRMVQDFSLRYPLLDGQGNFGSIDGNSAAAYRYTESRLTPIAIEMLADIDKETVGSRQTSTTGSRSPPSCRRSSPTCSSTARAASFGNAEAVFATIKKIAHREGYLGNLLAEGSKRASAKLGKESEKYAIQIKGMEQSAYATHNATTMLISYMTCDVGAHHNRAWAITYDLQVGRDKVVPEKVARVIWLQNFRPMFDVLGSCRLQWVELGIDRDLYVQLLEAITGVHRSWEDMQATGERIWNLTRLYWSREIEDFGRDWDQPSPRFYTEAPATGATAGQITKYEDVQKLLDMYYEQRGWDATGHLTPATLERLNLSEVAVN